MEKPIVFFSHSSRDEKSLRLLKRLVENKTGGAINIFLSSDGQSIPFGKNWVYKIDESLSKTSLMFVFLTPNSIKSNWIYFETGYSYSRGVKVVPVGLGVDLETINPPLSLLQGFNLNRPDALGNIIAIINDTYNTRFENSFEQTEFELLFSNNDLQLGISALNNLNVRLEYKPEIKPLEPISEVLMKNNIQYVISGDMMWSPGLQIQISENQKVGIIIDGLMVGFYLPILHHICERNEYTLSAGGQVYFDPKYFLATEGFVRQTALLAETQIRPEIGQYLKYKDVSFQLVSINHGWSSTRLDVHYKDNLITYEWLREVCQILLDKRLVILDNTRSPVGSSVTRIG